MLRLTDSTQSLSKSLLASFSEVEKLILKFIQKFKGPRIAKQSYKRTKLRGSHFPVSKIVTKLWSSRHHGIRIDI